MPKLRSEETAQRVLEFAKFLRDEYLDPAHFDGWPGLPNPGEPLELEDANFYVLGCCIDLQEYSWKSWAKAERFCKEVVPSQHRKTMWKWIADHPLDDWNAKKKTKGMTPAEAQEAYDLHWMGREHERVHRVATAIAIKYGGDPRNIWLKQESDSVLRRFEEELGLGEGIARMMVIGLRDHGLVEAVSGGEFKADEHVCRIMCVLGLSPSEKPSDVMKAGRRWFGDEAWLVDGALWELGKDYEIATLSEFVEVCDMMDLWKSIRGDVQTLVGGKIKSCLFVTLEDLQWDIQVEHTPHWAGVYLRKTRGPLAATMADTAETEIWAWIGVGWYKSLVTAIDVGGHPRYFSSDVKSLLQKLQLKELKQTSSGRWGMREYYKDSPIPEPNEILEDSFMDSMLRVRLREAAKCLEKVESTF